MFPRNSRIVSAGDFNRVRRFGKSFSCPIFVLSCIFQKSTPARFGVIVSNKVDKRSTERHRIKRILLELFRKSFDTFNNRGMFVLIARPAASGKRYEEFSSEFNKVLSKVSFP